MYSERWPARVNWLVFIVVSLGAGMCHAGATINWLDEQGQSFMSLEELEKYPNCFPGGMRYFASTISDSDLVVVGKVQSTLPRRFNHSWFTEITLDICDLVHGPVSGETITLLSTNVFVPESNGRYLFGNTIDGPGWILEGDLVLVALRVERNNPAIKGRYYLAIVRYLRDDPRNRDQVSYVQWSIPEYDWEGFDQAKERDEKADPYDYLTLGRARGATLREDISVLLGRDGNNQ